MRIVESFVSLRNQSGLSWSLAQKVEICYAVEDALRNCPIGHEVHNGEIDAICEAVYRKERDCMAYCVPAHEAFAYAYVKEFGDDPDYERRVLMSDETDDDDEAYWSRLRKEARI